MRPDDDACYRALASKDPRFDGRFFTGVRTTGIYCRPVCPARVPARRNVRFYPTAAAAEAAGFRPCLRCRPETSPGTPVWSGTSATVARALRLIDAGVLDAGGVRALGTRLGVGERHLRRLFVEHLGAAPLAVAKTRRIQIAKRLLDETALPMTAIAAESGFASVRRFNAAMRAVYGRPPGAIRRSAEPAGGRALALRLPYRPPYDWERVLAYLAPRAIPGVESVQGGVYRRLVAVEGGAAVVEIRHAARERALRLAAPPALARRLPDLVRRARRLFDLGADPREIRAALAEDPALRARLRGRPDVRVPGAWDGFELAVRAIVGQQVSVAGATTLAGRLARAHGTRVETPQPELTHLFPTPKALSGFAATRAGMPAGRARAIAALASAVDAGALDLDAAGDAEAVRARLEALPGVGAWTAAYVAMRALGEPDAFPASDLGLRRAFERGGKRPSSADLERRAERWRPWRAYAAMLLWTSE